MAPSAYEKVIAKRDVLEADLLRINACILNHPNVPLTERLIELHEQSIADNVATLKMIQGEILTLTPDTENDTNMKKFYNICNVADSMCNTLHGIKVTMQNQTTSTTNLSSHSAVTKLPKLDLKPFDGNLLEWTSFRDMYESAIHSNPNVPKVQKLVYLKTLLRGEAARQVQSLVLSEANYDTAWLLLNQRYQNDREILFAVLRRLFSLPHSNSSAHSMRNLVDSTKECIRSMEILNLKPEKATESIILYTLVERLDNTSRQLWEQSLNGTTIPPLDVLFEFLEQRARALAASGSNPRSKPHNTEEKTKRVQVFHGQSTLPCKCCSGNYHPLFRCSKFLTMGIASRYDILKKHSSCFNCLTDGHSTKNCSSKYRCKLCKQSHHTLLHPTSNPENSPDRVTSSQALTKNPHDSKKLTSTQGLLVTAVTQVEGKNGSHHLCRSFLDSGSTTSFISEAFLNELGLKRRKSNVQVVGLASTSVGTAIGSVLLTIHPYFDKTVSFQTEALVIPKVTQNLPENRLNPCEHPHLSNLKLADPAWYEPAPIDMLLGSEVFWKIVGPNRITGAEGSPVGVESKLGWLVTGTVTTPSNLKDVKVHYNTEQSLNEQLQRFWEIENLQEKKLLTPTESKCENHFTATYQRNQYGIFEVALPFKSNFEIGSSQQMAKRRLFSLEKRLALNPEHREQYNQFMSEYETMGHMTNMGFISTLSNSNLPVFIPHHFVLKDDSTTTKFRVVFDASARTSNGASLNDCLLVGPTLQDTLVDIIHRFRKYPIAFTADIAKMYRQILVRPDDRKFQYIFWRKSSDEEIQIYRLNTVTYGTACAPYLAVKCLRTLADESVAEFPIGAPVTKENFYVDDIMHSVQDLPTAIQTQDELRNLCSKGGFTLRKWTSNSSEFLRSVPEDLRETNHLLDLTIESSVKTLGLRWNTHKDCFQFQYQPTNDEEWTKRSVLSSIAKLYDPLGWLAPVIVKSKIFMQHLWKIKLDWDDPLPGDELVVWKEITQDLIHINQVMIPRCLIKSKPLNIVIAGFSDASEKAYSACIYLCCYYSNSSEVSLLSSKTKVAPVKTISLPRLELCGAVLLVNLMESVSSAVKLENITHHAWTDSTIVLSWLNSPASRWKTFVANRVSIIQSSSVDIQWHHVRSEDNPADCASRGLLACELINFDLWWYGPSMLKSLEYDVRVPPPNENVLSVLKSEEKAVLVSCLSTQINKSESLIDRYSNFTVLVRVVAWCYRFVSNSKTQESKQKGPLLPSELRKSMLAIVRSVQCSSFSEEFKSLKKKLPISTKSKLLNLNPFLDVDGVLRVGGRLRHSKLQYDHKFPMLLPRHNKLTDLVINYYYLKYLHAGCSLTLAMIQRQFWIIRGRDAVRFHIHKCVRCAKMKATPESQFMGDLPASRLTPTFPFDRCGVDYAGPFNLKTTKGKRTAINKAYLALFVCFTTRAFHLELVSSLSTEAFLAAFRRFVSRRGLPSHVHSDCGTNFVGANKELKKLVTSNSHNEAMSKCLSKDSVQWHFNPAGAPHFGGLWEAGVKSVKYHLNRILIDYRLTFEEMSTTLTQVEACLNSRPLTAISSDPNSFEVLTSGHFLIGRPLVAAPDVDVMTVHQNRLTRWQLLQKLNQQFWSRWSLEFLSRLQQRPKWLNHRKNIKINDLVIIKDNFPPQQWKLGRVIQVHPGKDGVVRVVTLKTAEGTYKRPIVKICLLPIITETKEELVHDPL